MDKTISWSLEELEHNTELRWLCSKLVTTDVTKVGRYMDIPSTDLLLDKLLHATLEYVKPLPHSKSSLYRTSDIGIGYTCALSVPSLLDLVSLGKLSRDVKIHLLYSEYGNINAHIDITDIDISMLLSDVTYIYVNDSDRSIRNMAIGKPTNPNWLYYKELLHKTVIPISKAKSMPRLNRVQIYDSIAVYPEGMP